MKKLNELQSYLTRLRGLMLTLIILCSIGSGNAWGTDFSTTYNYSGQGTSWSITNASDEDNYYKSSSSSDCVVTVSGIFTGKTITSNVVITLDVACFGNGTNPTSSKFTIYNSSSCSSQVTASQTGTLPSSSSYTSPVYTITKANATAGFTNDLVIKIAAGTKLIRFRSFRVEFSYTASSTYNVYVINTGCTGGSYSSNKGTSGAGTGDYSTCTKYSGITAGTSVTITATPSSGYQFDGWTNGGYSIILDDESNEITPSSTTSTTATFTMPSSDVVIWDCNFSETCANTMTINKGTATNCTFSLGTSGSGIATCSGASTTVSITPTDGYGTPVVSQSGASKTPSITGSGNSQTVTYQANTTGTSTINVSCSANEYTITLDKDLTPTTAGTANITATYNANTNLTSAITKPTKTGWTFGGYFTAKNGGGTQIIDASGNVIASVSGYTDASKNWKHAGNITLYAKWTCTVTWSVNGQTNVYSQQTITYNPSGSKVSSVPTPNPASYCGQVFAGWTTEEYSGNSAPSVLFKTVGDSPNLNSTGSVTFYAVFADYAD